MPTLEELARASRRRTAVLASIRRSIATRGYPPSVSELAREHDVTGRTIRTDLAALAATNRIEVDPGVPRGIRLVAS